MGDQVASAERELFLLRVAARRLVEANERAVEFGQRQSISQRMATIEVKKLLPPQ